MKAEKITNNQIKRLVDNYSNIAKEAVTVEIIVETIYVFGSELATLKLLKKFNKAKNVNQGYSENLETFYFSIDLDIKAY